MSRDLGEALSAPGELVAELAGVGFGDAEEIGRGGFGVVYRATQPELARAVAIKVLTIDLGDNRARFVREQKATGQLTGHPNIVAVLQVGQTQSGTPFLVMPYCAQGCLQERIASSGGLELDEVLRVGVKIAAALETAHRAGIVHRDVKPGNILLTDYGEPALCDFGIAHTGVGVANEAGDGFHTQTGIFTGSPAYTAPELLSGVEPSPASDVYGLGATLFAALTGRAPFERREGEHSVAQYIRISTEAAPDLRQHDVADDVAAVIERAMAREPVNRPSALGLGELLQQVQADHGLPVDELAVHGIGGTQRRAVRPSTPAPARGRAGRLPALPTGLVGRDAELAQLRELVDESRLVTLTGIGGVGKTSLATHLANELRPQFPDGVWVVELQALRDGSLLTQVLAETLEKQDLAGRSLTDLLINFLAPRETLMVLDNCEQIIDDVAKLVETLLRDCPQLRVVATSREVLSVTGEAVLALPPLGCPPEGARLSLDSLGNYDAVNLFVQRARGALPGFTLTENNADAVARICSGLDGLPLAIELAAARLRALSVHQIAQGLADRYALLRRGRRSAPERQQSLTRCVEWSYELCTEAEQQLWLRLSVFAGSFDLPAAQHLCVDELLAEDPEEAEDECLDALCGLVDKSILIRIEHDDVVRFRLLETLREFGKGCSTDAENYRSLRRRHANWYQQLVADVAAQWFSDRQVYWLERIVSEMPNLREAMEFSLADAPRTALLIAVDLRQVWSTRGMMSESRRWLARVLDVTPNEPSVDRFRILQESALAASVSADVVTARNHAAEARELLEQINDHPASGLLDVADALVSFFSGDLQGACECCERAIAAPDEDDDARVGAMVFISTVLDVLGDSDGALQRLEQARAFTESRGESVWRSKVSTVMGTTLWRQGELQRALEAFEQGLYLSHAVNNVQTAVHCLEGLGWIAGQHHEARRAVVLMAATNVLVRQVEDPFLQAVDNARFHQDCEQLAREELGPAEFDAAWGEGSTMTFDQAVAFALAAG